MASRRRRITTPTSAYSASQWVIDSYQGKTPEYSVVRKAIALRDASLRKAAELLLAQYGWGPERLERFREAAIQQMRVDFKVDPQVEEAVRCWQTEKDWAKGPELGGWSEALIKELGDADLRGLGGAGIPVTQKWKDVRDAVRTARARGEDDRAFIVVNGDESEPGTFKDRELLLRAPHTILEGVILAGLITEATQGFIYIRHEYEEQIEACRAEIARAEELGFCGDNAPVARPLVSRLRFRQSRRLHLRRAERAHRGDVRSPRRAAQHAAEAGDERPHRSPDARQQRRDLRVGAVHLPAMAARPTPATASMAGRAAASFPSPAT